MVVGGESVGFVEGDVSIADCLKVDSKVVFLGNGGRCAPEFLSSTRWNKYCNGLKA